MSVMGEGGGLVIGRDDIVFDAGVRSGFVASGVASMTVYTAPPFERFLLMPTSKRIYTIEMHYENQHVGT